MAEKPRTPAWGRSSIEARRRPAAERPAGDATYRTVRGSIPGRDLGNVNRGSLDYPSVATSPDRRQPGRSDHVFPGRRPQHGHAGECRIAAAFSRTPSSRNSKWKPVPCPQTTEVFLAARSMQSLSPAQTRFMAMASSLRNGVLDARNYFAATGDSLKRNQFGGTIGGPVRKDELFFFADFQRTTERTAPATSGATVPRAGCPGGEFPDVSQHDVPSQSRDALLRVCDEQHP